MRAIQGLKAICLRRFSHKELTELVTGEVYHAADFSQVPIIQMDGLKPGGPAGVRAAVHLSAGHLTKGRKVGPGQAIPNNNAYYASDARNKHHHHVIILYDVKMLREKGHSIAI